MKPKISIIVPVYNVELYINKCINTILNQTFKNFELILIDDGSTDNSGEICDEYLEIDERVRVIHKENTGLSDARNVGINIAKGDYIGFVDSDDTINPKMYEILYNLCQEHNADISTCLIRTIDINKERRNNKEYTNKVYIYSNKYAIKETYDGGISGYSSCNKLYRSYLFEDIKFPKGRIYEDASILYKLYMKSNKVVFIDKALYNYIHREGSITRSRFSKKRFDIIEMYNEKYEFMCNNYPEMCEKIKSMYYESLRNIIIDIVIENSTTKNYKYIRDVSRYIRRELKYILNNSLVSIQHKIWAILLAFFPCICILRYKIVCSDGNKYIV